MTPLHWSFQWNLCPFKLNLCVNRVVAYEVETTEAGCFERNGHVVLIHTSVDIVNGIAGGGGLIATASNVFACVVFYVWPSRSAQTSVEWEKKRHVSYSISPISLMLSLAWKESVLQLFVIYLFPCPTFRRRTQNRRTYPSDSTVPSGVSAPNRLECPRTFRTIAKNTEQLLLK